MRADPESMDEGAVSGAFLGPFWAIFRHIFQGFFRMRFFDAWQGVVITIFFILRDGFNPISYI